MRLRLASRGWTLSGSGHQSPERKRRVAGKRDIRRKPARLRSGLCSRGRWPLTGRCSVKCWLACLVGSGLAGLVATNLAGCPSETPSSLIGDTTSLTFNNTTDPTNANATYLTSAACKACHPDVGAEQGGHGHAHALTRVEGGPPSYPAAATRAGVPNPPPGRTWADVAYVIGGYFKRGLFVDQGGYVMTTGVLGVNTQWNLAYPRNGTSPGFAAYEPTLPSPQPFDYTCFRCHVTGAQAPSANNPQTQDNRPGMAGTWAEPGVLCEACHGPGSNHVPRPHARGIYVGLGAENCGRCHALNDDPNVILAADGFIQSYQQWSELRASGGHSGFQCLMCHDPHASTTYDASGLLNDCTDCHWDRTIPLHTGKVFVWVDYVEPVVCRSCHMPLATKNAAIAAPAVVGDQARLGDTRTHIFRINPDPVDYQTMLSADGSHVVKDAAGRAAATVDFVCLRCHHGAGSAPAFTVPSASQIAENMHARLAR